jgi:hypothetical protein
MAGRRRVMFAFWSINAVMTAALLLFALRELAGV